MSSSSSIFSGTSRFSSDFSSVIDRAVSIASLPMNQLTASKTTLTDQQSALTDLNTQFSNLQTAFQTVSDAMGSNSLSVSSSDSSLLNATISSGAVPGSYQVEVSDIGAFAASLSASAWTTGSETGTYQLQLGGETIDISPSDDSAAAVARAINSTAGDKVRATVVNVGGSGSPDYRLSLQAVKLGDLAPGLLKDGTDLQMQQTTGRLASYVVAQSGTTVTSDTREVSIADGLTVTLAGSSPGTQVNVTVTQSSAGLSNALSSLASAYNGAVDALDKQHGSSAGALAGQSLILDIAHSLSQLATYTAADGSGLDTIGLKLGQDGHLTFDSSAFSTAMSNNSSTVLDFLGSTSTTGFLKLAGDTLTGIEDSSTGEIAQAQLQVQNSISSTTTRINDEQDRIDALKANLQEQMSNADALIASMEQQYNYIASVFSSMTTDTTSLTK